MFIMYAVKYALERICDSSSAKFASELGVTPRVINRLLKRIEGGDGSPKLINITMEWYAKQPELLREVAAQYALETGEPLEYPRTCRFSSDMEKAASFFTERAEQSAYEKRLAYMNKCAREFISAMEGVCCGRNTDHFPSCVSYGPAGKSRSGSTVRPCQQLIKLVKSIERCLLCPGMSKWKKP